MAWPSTPLRTYNPMVAPYIYADDLNSFQTGINGIINGTYTLAAATIKGGSQGTTPISMIPGTVGISFTTESTGGYSNTVPTTYQNTRGVIYPATTPLFWASFSDNGGVITVNESVGLNSIVRGDGINTSYLVETNTSGLLGGLQQPHFVFCTLLAANGGLSPKCWVQTLVFGSFRLDVVINVPPPGTGGITFLTSVDSLFIMGS